LSFCPFSFGPCGVCLSSIEANSLTVQLCDEFCFIYVFYVVVPLWFFLFKTLRTFDAEVTYEYW